MHPLVRGRPTPWPAIGGTAAVAAAALLLFGGQLWPLVGVQPRVPPLRSAADPWARYVAPEAECPGGDDASAPADVQERAMLCLLRWARARRSLPELRVSTSLMQSALLKARDIVGCRDFSHTACGRSDLAAFEAVGYTRSPWIVGENLAWGGGRLGAPARALELWLHSPPHRRALFGQAWAEIGVAESPIAGFRGEPSGEIWVSHFGRRY